ncbi:MAG TPA: hypothetical protein PKJ97_01725, partial [Candidatus Bilamarchaeaceae archaeon]|nr:hypothetical protein [Candidatus Bilamarchaeaceae archaeon]
GYLSTRETGDSSGKMRISREGNEFSFYTWNSTDSSWILESSANLSLSKALFVSFESESAYSGWGAINASWDNFTITHNNYTYAIFNNTDLLGLYNVSFYVRDQKGAVNNTEKTNFTIIQVNDPPSTPFILAPSPGSRIYGLFNITWSEVYDEEGDSVWFNITLLNPDYSFNYSIASNYGNISSVMHEWNTSEVPDGFYSMQVLVFENETVERLSNQYTLPGTFEIDNTPNVPPSLIVLSPLGETYVDRKPVSIAANITDIDGINESYAIITFPNGTTENLTLAQCSGGDNFDMDTVGLGWQVENISIGPSQACTANINGTIPGKAYTYLTGDGSPYTDTLCSLVSMRAIYGDFDMNVSFEILDETGVDNAINFQVMELGTSAEASLLAFISLSNWTGLGRNYEVFVDDGEISDYIATVPSDDTYGKMRIRREGSNFTFFVWNNTDSSWIELNSTELNLTSSLYVAIESESAYSGWGTMGASWDNLSIAHDDTYFNVFNSRVHPVGLYNVSFYARDNRGGVNDTERSNFTIIDANDPPSKPYILAPYPGATVQGTYNITWSGVSDPDGDSLQFNITLLNPDGSDNATIVSDYGNDSSVRYEWDTTLFPDGEYSMRIIVFENETVEQLSNHYTIPGTFFINNNVPSVIILSPLGETYVDRKPVSIAA